MLEFDTLFPPLDSSASKRFRFCKRSQDLYAPNMDPYKSLDFADDARIISMPDQQWKRKRSRKKIFQDIKANWSLRRKYRFPRAKGKFSRSYGLGPPTKRIH